ncbi:MAG: sulfotransferase [Burkholderiales bacterium]|jgi:hypothetical protein|nr:sulfotransferase [Burkholderiales bacterium]
MIENLFICIGAQKAGTSWLHAVLKNDPAFAMTPYTKEIHYFDFVHRGSPHLNNWRAWSLKDLLGKRPVQGALHLAAWLDEQNKAQALLPVAQKEKKQAAFTKNFDELTQRIDDDWYTDIFGLRPDQDYCLDITPDYAVIGESGFSHMKSVAKNLKLLFILREPVDRTWSGLLQGQKNSPLGIDGFLKSIPENLNNIVQDATVGLNVGARSNYVKTLKNLEKAWLTDNLLIKFYDDISENPRAFIDDIYRHIGKQAPWHLENFEAAIAQRVYVTQGKTEIPAELRAALKAFYKVEIGQLNEMIGVPKAWLEK